MPFDCLPPEREPPKPWPPPNMWCDQTCSRCRGSTAYGRGEPCNQCGRQENGSLE